MRKHNNNNRNKTGRSKLLTLASLTSKMSIILAQEQINNNIINNNNNLILQENSANSPDKVISLLSEQEQILRDLQNNLGVSPQDREKVMSLLDLPGDSTGRVITFSPDDIPDPPFEDGTVTLASAVKNENNNNPNSIGPNSPMFGLNSPELPDLNLFSDLSNPSDPLVFSDLNNDNINNPLFESTELDFQYDVIPNELLESLNEIETPNPNDSSQVTSVPENQKFQNNNNNNKNGHETVYDPQAYENQMKAWELQTEMWNQKFRDLEVIEENCRRDEL